VIVLMALCSLKKERPEAQGSTAHLVDALVARRRLSGQGGTEPHPTRPTLSTPLWRTSLKADRNGRHPRFGPARVVIAAAESPVPS